MAAGSQKLSARGAATKKPGRYGDGDGLYLIVSTTGGRKWIFRFTHSSRVSEMGLGSADVVTLAEAREKAQEARRLVKAGKNPVEAKRQAAVVAAGMPSFGAVAEDLIAAKEREWRNAIHRKQWHSSIFKNAASLCSRPVDEIDTAAVLAVLTPLWQTMPESASRLRGRIEAVLDAAKAKGHRSGENPAAWRGHLSHLLPKRGKLARGHYPAMDYKEVPAFMIRLRACETVAAMALEFVILTATRSNEVYKTQWPEIDFKARIWTIPASRMKGARDHRVPLSADALSLLKKLHAARTCEFVFPSPYGHRPLSHVAMAKVLDRLEIVNATPHGFRSSFRDWAGNETNFPREIAEAALAHTVGNAVETAYRRSDALEKRRALMEAWSKFCSGSQGVKVLRLKGSQSRSA